MTKRVSRPNKALAVIALASQTVFMMDALDDRESTNSGVTAPAANVVPPVGTKNANIKARATSRNQAMHLTTVDRTVCATEH